MMLHDGVRGVDGGSLLHLCLEAIPSRFGRKGKGRDALLEGRGISPHFRFQIAELSLY